MKKSLQAERDTHFSKGLRQRYRLVVDLLRYTTLQRLHQDLLVVYKDRIKVLQKKISLATAEITDLIAAEDQRTKLELEILKIEDRLSEIHHHIHITFGPKFLSRAICKQVYFLQMAG